MLNFGASEKKFIAIYHKYEKLVMDIAFSILNDKYLAEEAFQSAFFSVTQNLDKMDIHSDEIEKTIKKIARNSAIDIYRKNRLIRHHEIPIPENEESDEANRRNIRKGEEIFVEGSFEDDILRKFELDEVLELLNKLERRHKIYIREYYWEGLSMRQIAERHGISEEAAKKRVRRSVEKLRKKYFDERSGI